MLEDEFERCAVGEFLLHRALAAQWLAAGLGPPPTVPRALRRADSAHPPFGLSDHHLEQAWCYCLRDAPFPYIEEEHLESFASSPASDASPPW